MQVKALKAINDVPSSFGSGLNVLRKGGREHAANAAHTRQSRPDYGLVFQVKAIEYFNGLLFSLGSGHSALKAGEAHEATNLA